MQGVRSVAVMVTMALRTVAPHFGGRQSVFIYGKIGTCCPVQTVVLMVYVVRCGDNVYGS